MALARFGSLVFFCSLVVVSFCFNIATVIIQSIARHTVTPSYVRYERSTLSRHSPNTRRHHHYGNNLNTESFSTEKMPRNWTMKCKTERRSKVTVEPTAQSERSDICFGTCVASTDKSVYFQ